MKNQNTTDNEMKNDLTKFIHEAFCIKGTTKLIRKTHQVVIDEKVVEGSFIECIDEKRGTFYVGMFK